MMPFYRSYFQVTYINCLETMKGKYLLASIMKYVFLYLESKQGSIKMTVKLIKNLARLTD